jgi:tetraacyldisaccharide 4'-kinase
VNPLSAAYGALTQFRNMIYDSGLFSAQLRGPVISVGSISAGGAGKTPLVILLGDLLKVRQIPFDVLSRGYGRKTTGVLLVDPAGDASGFGDEPLLIARRLSVPVVVGENRYHAGLFAEQRFGPQLHLLDDGFQHRALARDFDIALLTALEQNDHLLPAGRLREPLASLDRADVVAFSLHTEHQQPRLGHFVATSPVLDTSSPRYWRVRRHTVLPSAFPSQAVAFCGIARPENFFDGVGKAGALVLGRLAFPDHHSYLDQDIERLLRIRKEKGANGFITTEKDVANLGTRQEALQPLAVARVQMELEDADRVISHMLEVVSARQQARS